MLAVASAKGVRPCALTAWRAKPGNTSPSIPSIPISIHTRSQWKAKSKAKAKYIMGAKNLQMLRQCKKCKVTKSERAMKERNFR